jgi:hypothetical protein
MGTMKMTEEKLDKFVEFIRNHLRKTLGREPTEKELVNSLPVLMCNIDEKPETERS